MPLRRHLLWFLTAGLLATLAGGCTGRSTTNAPAPAGAGVAAETPMSPELQEGLSKIVNDETIRYRPLDYSYDEDLLSIVDQEEAYLSGKSETPPPRFLPKLDEDEEHDHFRQTIRRWEAKAGKTLRPVIDTLKAEVAARKPGEPVPPDFHKRFSSAFDDFIKIEVEEARERRNRAIHKAAEALMAQYRARYPDQVRQLEASLNAPPYRLTPTPADVPPAQPGGANP